VVRAELVAQTVIDVERAHKSLTGIQSEIERLDAAGACVVGPDCRSVRPVTPFALSLRSPCHFIRPVAPFALCFCTSRAQGRNPPSRSG
jgi:hypothetical protein